MPRFHLKHYFQQILPLRGQKSILEGKETSSFSTQSTDTHITETNMQCIHGTNITWRRWPGKQWPSLPLPPGRPPNPLSLPGMLGLSRGAGLLLRPWSVHRPPGCRGPTTHLPPACPPASQPPSTPKCWAPRAHIPCPAPHLRAPISGQSLPWAAAEMLSASCLPAPRQAAHVGRGVLAPILNPE